MEGFILKKSTSLLFSGLLVSGMVLGTLPMTQTVQAADKVTTQAAASVTNNVTYYYNNQKVGQKSLQGTQGQPLGYYPDGYTYSGSIANFQEDGANVKVNVTKMISAKVNYVDQNNNLVNSEVVNGGDGNKYTLTDIPAGSTLLNDADKTITLEDGKEYNIKVNKQVFNTLIFKTADNTEVGRAEIYSQNVGDTVDLTDSQIPSGYTAATKSVTLQSDNNTQIVTVTKNADSEQPTGVVTVKNQTAQLYTVYGNTISGRTLSANSSWKYYESKTINGETYYRVATDEWVKASDVTSEATTSNVTPFENVVTTKDAITHVYTKDGQEVTGRALSANSSWKTANKLVLNDETYYQVATNEWVKANDVTVNDDTTGVTPAKGVVTIGSSVAQLYTKDGQAITSRALAPSSKWQTANKMDLKGETYYQVATNEWVKASSLV